VTQTTVGVSDAQLNDEPAVDLAAWQRLVPSGARRDREVFSVRVERVSGPDVEPLWASWWSPIGEPAGRRHWRIRQEPAGET
jgi:hypothetical protein